MFAAKNMTGGARGGRVCVRRGDGDELRPLAGALRGRRRTTARRLSLSGIRPFLNLPSSLRQHFRQGIVVQRTGKRLLQKLKLFTVTTKRAGTVPEGLR